MSKLYLLIWEDPRGQKAGVFAPECGVQVLTNRRHTLQTSAAVLHLAEFACNRGSTVSYRPSDSHGPRATQTPQAQQLHCEHEHCRSFTHKSRAGEPDFRIDAVRRNQQLQPVRPANHQRKSS